MIVILSMLAMIVLAKGQLEDLKQTTPVKCRKYFSYKENKTSDEIYGQIDLPPIKIDFSKKNLLVEIEMAMVTQIPPLEAGVEIFFVSDFHVLENGGKSTYHVFFPTQRHIPKLLMLKADGKLICRGNPPSFNSGEFLVNMLGNIYVNGVKITQENEATVDMPSNPYTWGIESIIAIILGYIRVVWNWKAIILLPILINIFWILARFIWFILLCYGY